MQLRRHVRVSADDGSDGGAPANRLRVFLICSLIGPFHRAGVDPCCSRYDRNRRWHSLREESRGKQEKQYSSLHITSTTLPNCSLFSKCLWAAAASFSGNVVSITGFSVPLKTCCSTA